MESSTNGATYTEVNEVIRLFCALNGESRTKPVHSIFAFQITVGKFSFNFNGAAFYSDFVARLHVGNFNFVTVFFSTSGCTS